MQEGMQFMTRRNLILMLMLAGINICSCLNDRGDPFMAIGGKVKDSMTKTPLEEVWYDSRDTVIPHNNYTDTSGEFVLSYSFRPNSTVNLYFGKEGYQTKETTITFPANIALIEGIEILLVQEQKRRRWEVDYALELTR